jgi:Holliday junction resolvasome RuvABC ATP-dependent DNA helicase subunit
MGGGIVRLSGTVEKGAIKVKGGSELTAPKLKIQAADITVLGASTSVLSVEKSLQARVENESKLDYFGSPGQVASDTKLNGKIVHRIF